MTKRKSFRNRTQANLQVERDRWLEFIELCDKERKSVSLKIDEMLAEELQKNALGAQTPINILYGIEKEKPLPVTLDEWMQRIESITEPAVAGQIEGFHKVLMVAAKTKFYELKKRSIMKE